MMSKRIDELETQVLRLRKEMALVLKVLYTTRLIAVRAHWDSDPSGYAYSPSTSGTIYNGSSALAKDTASKDYQTITAEALAEHKPRVNQL
jgi:hypothetical protein